MTHPWCDSYMVIQEPRVLAFSFQEYRAHLQSACRKELEGRESNLLTSINHLSPKPYISLLFTFYCLKLVTWSHPSARDSGKCSQFSAITLFYGKGIIYRKGVIFAIPSWNKNAVTEKVIQKETAIVPSTMWGHSEKALAMNQEKALIQPCWCHDLGLPASRT